MADWDQLDAMGDLARLNQAKALAKQQAQRDAQLAAQNAEVVRLLKEQKEREEAEKARIAAMPKCPDCLKPVEVGSRRCPHCRSGIVSWDYASEGQSWRLICREADAPHSLQNRCERVAREAVLHRDACIRSMEFIDNKWQQEVLDACRAIRQVVSSYNADSRNLLLDIVEKRIAGEPLTSPREEASLQKLRDQCAAEFSSATLLTLQADLKQKEDKVALSKTSKPLVWVIHFMTLSCSVILVLLLWGKVSSDGWRESLGAICSIAVAVGVLVWTSLWFIKVTRQRETAVAMAAAVLAEFREREATARSTLQAKVMAVSSAWEEKLAQIGLLQPIEVLVTKLRESMEASLTACEAYKALSAALLALASTREFMESLGTPVSATLGDNHNWIRLLSTHDLVAPRSMVNDSYNLNDICRNCDTTLRAFRSSVARLKSLPL
jgi:hypothetical protein